MDLVLHKKLLELQAENTQLKEKLQQINELFRGAFSVAKNIKTDKPSTRRSSSSSTGGSTPPAAR